MFVKLLLMSAYTTKPTSKKWGRQSKTKLSGPPSVFTLTQNIPKYQASYFISTAIKRLSHSYLLTWHIILCLYLIQTGEYYER